MAGQSFIVQRNDLRQFRVVDDAAARAPLADGAVRLRVDLFALTSNNITYGVFGDSMRYWDFFPCEVAGFGRIPVWGFADVVESRAGAVAAGERFYGYYPISSHVVLQPVDVKDGGFVDGAAHRSDLHPLYNRYLRCSADPGYDAAHEAETAVLRPLFATAFLIDDFLADSGFFGAGQVLLSSASSKTAYSTAFCLAQRRGTPGAPKIVGLTSHANASFAGSLGCYDAVVTYDEVATLAADTPAVYVDMSGNATVRDRVHRHFGDALAHDCAVGGTHWDARGSAKGLPGPRPVFFFAPDRIKKRQADWGGAGLGQRIAQAWRTFLPVAADGGAPWMRVVRGDGPRDCERVYRALLEGGTDPREGHVLRL